jgi:predicted metal-dependent HD superfamily phosphohydrolase
VAVLDQLLKRFREKIRRREYVMTIHAEEEMDADALTILDVEASVLTGRIVERQRDVRRRASGSTWFREPAWMAARSGWSAS